MAMDRAEKLGLGVAVGGHALLLGAFALGLLASAKTAPKQESISVSLVGEIADVSTAPDAIQEESAAPAPGDTAPAEPPPAPTQVMQIAKPVKKPQATPISKPVKQPPAKAAAVSGKGTTPAKPGGLSRSFLDSINNIGKTPGAGKAVGTPAAKTAAEVRRSVTAILGPQIQRRIEACSPTGVELNKIITTITLNLDISGNLLNVNYGRQDGVNASNQPQAEPLKQCILQAARAASPFRNLDPEYHDVWKSHPMRIKARG